MLSLRLADAWLVCVVGFALGCQQAARPVANASERDSNALAAAPVDVFDDDAWSPGSEPAAPTKAGCAADSARAKSAWEAFRKRYPLHVQTVALSPAFASGCRALIVAEPPPGTTREDLEAIDPTVLGGGSVETQPIGADGWVKDAVFVLPPLAKSQERSLISKLHLRLFGTTYKADAEWLDDSGAALQGPDLQVRPNELLSWVVESTATFTPIEGGPPLTGRALLDRPTSGVFTKSDDGLVVWALPRSGSFDEQRAPGREFFVDSDLIVGALGSDQTVLIVGRRRMVSETRLRPLRFETVKLLTETRAAELLQSYERLSVVAGFLDATNEWAPILLSPELIDTEYGSLLNITDQILKGWSTAGDTKYERFDYGPPSSWIFKRSVYQQIGGSVLTFNWNTKGAGALVRVDGVDVFSLRRTGALNVTYLPESYAGAGNSTGISGMTPAQLAAVGRAQSFASQAQNAFASANDPNLIRVVQYNAFYQIFRSLRYGSGPANEDASAPRRVHQAMTQRIAPLAGRLLERLARASHAEIQAAAQRYLDDGVAAMKAKGMSDEDIASTNRIIGMMMTASIMSIQMELASLTPRDMELLAWMLSGGRTWTASAQLDALQRRIDTQKFPIQNLLTGAAMRASYSAAFVPKPGSWIHTPSVVVSWCSGESLGLSGGHNLDSAVARTSVRRADLNRVSLVPTGVDIAAPPVPPRRPKVALALSEPSAPSGLRPSAVAAGTAPPPRGAAGWQQSHEVVSANDVGQGIAIERRNGTYLVKFGEERRAVEASSMVDVADALHRYRPEGAGTVAVELRGFNADEARVFSASMELRGNARFASSVKENAAIRARKLDFSRAEVFEPVIRKLGGLDAEVAVAMRVPTAGNQTFWYRVKVLLKNATPARIRDAVTALRSAVSKIVLRVRGEAAVVDVAKQIRIELEALLPSTIPNTPGTPSAPPAVEIKLRDEAFDVIIVRRASGNGNGGSRSIPI